MANVSKVYTISIQMDAAQQALDGAIKKLAALDKSLEGVATDSAAGKAIVADMAKAAAEVEKLQGQVGKLGKGLDDLVPLVPGSVGALRQEVVNLEAQLETAVVGSAELAATMQALGEKKSQLRELANAVNAANPRAQARAFTVFAGALTGVVGIATTAGQVFGLSSESAQQWAQRMQGLVGVLFSVEQISKSLNGENVALIKSVLASGKAYLAAGEAASTGSKITRAALISTGIGAIVVLIGTLVALWVEFGTGVSSSESTFTRFKATVVGGLQAMWAGLKDVVAILWEINTFQFTKAADTFRNFGKDTAEAYNKGREGVIAEAHRKENELLIENYARQIELAKAQGKNTLDLEIANSARKLANMKNESEEEKKAYLDQASALAVLQAQRDKKNYDERRAINQEHLTAQAQLVAAQGKANFAEELAAKESELDQLRSATERNEAAIMAKDDEIAAFQLAHAKELDDQARAALLARLDAHISLQQAKGREAFNLQVAREEQELAFLKSAAQRNEAQITAQQAKLDDLIAAHEQQQVEKRHAQKLAELDAIISLENVKGQDSYDDQLKREETQLRYLKEAGIRNEAAITAQLSKITNLKAAHELKEAADDYAAEVARMNARIALLQAQGEDTTQLQLDLKAKELTKLLAATDRNEAAIIAKQGEIDAAIVAQQIAVEEKRRALQVETFENEMTLLETEGKDTLALRIKFAQQQVALDTDTSEKGLARLRADTQKLKELEAEMGQRGPDLFATILTKLFGVKPEDVTKLQKELADAFGQLAQTTGQLASAYMDAATQAADQALTDAQTRLQTATDKLSQLQSSIGSDENKLAQSEGAARDYYLQKLQQEQAQVTKLAAAKAKAATDEKRATEDKHKLEKLGMELTAAATLGTNIAASAAAVYAGVKAVAGASAMPFPLSLPAIITAIAAVGAAVASARGLATATKYADGGIIDGGSHAQGGVPFTIAGRAGFEAEGGEFIINKAATAKNRALLEAINSAGRTQVLAPPVGHFANGGALPRGNGIVTGPGQVVVQAADLSELLATNRAMVAHLQAISGATAMSAAKPPLVIGPYEAHLIELEKQKATQSEAAATL